MEQITHSQHARRKRNSPKVNLIVSVVLHVIILGLGFFCAAKEGLMGNTMKTITADILEKAKKAEVKKPDTKTEEAKQEEVKRAVAEVKAVKAAVAAAGPTTAPPPPPAAAVTEAPPPVMVSDMVFGDVVTTDPIVSYKNQVETVFRNKWNRPADIDDANFVAEVELAVDAGGKVTGYDWKAGSGNARWDNSVKQALANLQSINRPPPKGFPDKFLVRFDVVAVEDAPALSQNN